jgi:hypothetical protein
MYREKKDVTSTHNDYIVVISLFIYSEVQNVLAALSCFSLASSVCFCLHVFNKTLTSVQPHAFILLQAD